MEVTQCDSNALSTMRTRHRFLHYGDFRTVDEFCKYRDLASKRGLTLYMLGNGSNTLFAKSTVQAVVLRNCLEPRIEFLPPDRMAVSSSVPIHALLRRCYENSLDAFYYLAAAPGTIGGAVAMNAGRGQRRGETVFDYLEEISYLAADGLETIAASDIEHKHRWTPFTGIHDKLIVSAVFRFPPCHFQDDPLTGRLRQAREKQDLTAPSCGSVFRSCSARIQKLLRGLRIGTACYSGKADNWILNYGDDPRPVLWLIKLSKALHRLVGQRADLELIEVS